MIRAMHNSSSIASCSGQFDGRVAEFSFFQASPNLTKSRYSLSLSEMTLFRTPRLQSIEERKPQMQTLTAEAKFFNYLMHARNLSNCDRTSLPFSVRMISTNLVHLVERVLMIALSQVLMGHRALTLITCRCSLNFRDRRSPGPWVARSLLRLGRPNLCRK
jgi:hypothetical protein